MISSVIASTIYASIIQYQSSNEWITNLSSYTIVLSNNISLNPGPAYNRQLLDSNEWNIFKSKGIHLIHLNVNNLLPKINEICYIAGCPNVAVIGITESNLDESIFQLEIQIDNHNLLPCDRNRNSKGAACYIRSDISYVQKYFYLDVIENIYLKFYCLKPHL